MMKEFEKHQCSFVSITQAFDTSTSMGKLTLNMLLSFAQFEREVASERIRDKIAASKAKGMWMGGYPPLGYDVKDKKLVVNKKEAEQVLFIFEKYLEVKSLIDLRDAVNQAGYRSKRFVTSTGKVRGVSPYASSVLARILRSQVYVGRIEHKVQNKAYKGRYRAIIDRELFNKVQALMDENQNKHNETHELNGYLLSGKLLDNRGNRFKNQRTSKNGLNLVKALSLGWRYKKMMTSGMTIKAVRRHQGMSERTIYKYFSLNYLSPRIVRVILDGKTPPGVNLQKLFEIGSRYPDFDDQERAFFAGL